jgi:hypothetical protein
MNPIPPSNLQSPQVPNVQTKAQNFTAEKKKGGIFAFIENILFELFLIVLFSAVILTTFNYFNLIPLSSIFPTLSFLPQQQSMQTAINTTSQDDVTFFSSNVSSLSACNPTRDKNIILQTIITCKNPTKIFNAGKNPIYSGIPNAGISSGDQMQINFALKIIPGKNHMQNGLMLGGGADENRMYISYVNPNSWGVQFLYGKTVTLFDPLYQPPSSSIQRSYFSIIISKDGKQVTILLPSGLMKSYTLQGSLYSKDGTIPATAVVEPNSEVDIYSLNYYTNQSQ